MKIRTDAWHYKVFMWSHLVPADTPFDTVRNFNFKVSLCPYFWRVFLALFWLPPVTLICLLGKAYQVPVHLWDDGLSSFEWKNFHPFVAYSYRDGPLHEGVVGILLYVFVIIAGLMALTHWEKVLMCIAIFVGGCLFILVIWALVALSWKISSVPKSDDSLVAAYLSAVKQKVCPKIEFVDED